MKILFLDIDGVLNSRNYLMTKPPGWRSGDAIDHDAVKLLNEVIERTGAQVVISSTWRETHTPELMQVTLERFGFVGNVIGSTPEPFRIPGMPALLSWSRRGDEIYLYLEAIRRGVTRYAIVDDTDDFLPEQQPFVVKTSFETGLRREHVEQLVAILGERG